MTLSPADPPHIPVLLEEVIETLSPVEGGLYVDGTFGAGGYTRALLAQPETRVIAFDRDPDAIREGADLVKASGGRLQLVNDCFSNMTRCLQNIGIDKVDGVVLDIGVSSMQIDRPERGFSIQADGPLDMRMAQEGQSAADFLNTADEKAIADVLYLYGEERQSRRVARAIVAARPLTKTSELARVIRQALGYRAHDKKDPAVHCFQAIRIHLNRELEELKQGLTAAETLLKPDGCLAIVTFHSLEDRIVKHFLKDHAGQSGQGSRHQPFISNSPMASFSKPIRPIKAGDSELARNPRARSATLRAARRTAAPAWDESGISQNEMDSHRHSRRKSA
ncbi:MAG: 16S rRNA (cytosine(1402)-N(4))-methyltransferase RsmH [Zymomonas mobilis subsp. pomaceae]|uniref:Ribosomal RNA small subunit methyltransferase H n=1 Tax=Zymomonas mobilis subsp. pomaceae (strain ATCC 29192 / DSM 22645 / JCM 10191 / CCUG 17912 / NBRC 13757 / NCIMB 11200 / NRRL B-4491 / Barker I) TaxID=579138 RepID=F8EVD6_ZYMMT|nr:16S rRNA (cytosine(1402)-N(4))-methyltransferase RsmH [Zymomonas mobilis]AEI37343.1 S-adenosyl-methyltransferase MraW [Zymomonas mobilis subsp. pomaceae ATCC 29192]MDX5948711.1 16S rRNA (cytosine(1402)-N(4))-methyltransferase RsmH [Zymomonas mobilis subsp. pomaceae]GEB88516.1 ribosomal RNA small subunit methyltransferase H [Zymomonas mobilis subsp. pomaceae]